MILLQTSQNILTFDLRRSHYHPVHKRGRLESRKTVIPAHLWLGIGKGICEIQQVWGQLIETAFQRAWGVNVHSPSNPSSSNPLFLCLSFVSRYSMYKSSSSSFCERGIVIRDFVFSAKCFPAGILSFSDGLATEINDWVGCFASFGGGGEYRIDRVPTVGWTLLYFNFFRLGDSTWSSSANRLFRVVPAEKKSALCCLRILRSCFRASFRDTWGLPCHVLRGCSSIKGQVAPMTVCWNYLRVVPSICSSKLWGKRVVVVFCLAGITYESPE